jgi:hypothetical protein
MSDSAVTSWSGDAAASRLGRLCLYAQVAFFGGLALVVAAAFALFALRSVQTGAYGQLALVALLALVGGPYSLLYLLPLLTDDDSRQSLTAELPDYGRLHWGGVAAATLLGAVSIVLAIGLGSMALLAAFLFVPAITFGVAGTLDSRGELDPDRRTLVYGDRDVGLGAVTGWRRCDAGGYTFLWLSYAGPNDLDQPRLVVLPRPAADAAIGVIPEEPAQPTTSQSTAERTALVATALVFLGLAAVLVAVGRGHEDAVALFAFAAMPGGLGVLLLYLAT